MSPTSDPAIRPAGPDDLVAVMRLFDGGLLETDAERIDRQLAGEGTGDDGCILLATDDGRAVGAIALTTEDIADRPPELSDAVHITAIAVQRSRRGNGCGRSLIAAAAEWAAPEALTATFDDRVRPFYTACGFEIEQRAGRLWGIRSPCCGNRQG